MQINIADDFTNPTDSLAVIVLKGTPESIRKQLQYIMYDTEKQKPIQGITIGADYVTQVITPVWNGKKY